MTTGPIYLDLDAVEPSVADFTVRLNGKDHKLAESTVKDFIRTARELENLSLGASVEKELEVTLGIIHRALPTVTKEELEGLTLPQLTKIKDFVMTANGEKAEEVKPDGTAEGNEPKAS